MRVLVTGAAGFIGSNAERSPAGARRRSVRLRQPQRVLRREAQGSATRAAHAACAVSASRKPRSKIAPRSRKRFAEFKPQRVVNLAAQAGVRYSIENPHAYVEANLVGFINVLEACRHGGVEHLVYASSSSVYGANRKLPFSVRDAVDHPVSLYAATKKANELMAHTYSHLYRLPTTGLRFFTVYGPWGRPDMALFLFTRNILAGKPIDVFNHGHHTRDFTYIDDIVEGVIRTLDNVAAPRSRVRCAESEPGHLERAVSSLQHRQPSAGRAGALYRADRGKPRAQGAEKPAAAAAGRCAGYVRRRRGTQPRCRLFALNARGNRHQALRRLVSRLFTGVAKTVRRSRK